MNLRILYVPDSCAHQHRGALGPQSAFENTVRLFPFAHQVRPHLEVGAVPAGGLGHVSGHAEAALHEGAGAHRQILRSVPAGAAVRGGGPQTAAAVVRPAAQQELQKDCGFLFQGEMQLTTICRFYEHIKGKECLIENGPLGPSHVREADDDEN